MHLLRCKRDRALSVSSESVRLVLDGVGFPLEDEDVPCNSGIFTRGMRTANVHYTLPPKPPYYSQHYFDSHPYPLFSKLCQHNLSRPRTPERHALHVVCCVVTISLQECRFTKTYFHKTNLLSNRQFHQYVLVEHVFEQKKHQYLFRRLLFCVLIFDRLQHFVSP